MSIRNKILIIIIIATGLGAFACLLPSTIIFSYKIPKIDAKINNKQFGLSHAVRADDLQQMYNPIISILGNQSEVLREINSTSSQLINIAKQQNRHVYNMLRNTYHALKGKPPTEEIKSVWKATTTAGLINIYKSLTGNYPTTTQEEINQLQKEKIDKLALAIKLQIIGLSLGQLTAILPIFLRKH